jgi:hypothetical protein
LAEQAFHEAQRIELFQNIICWVSQKMLNPTPGKNNSFRRYFFKEKRR